MKFRSNISNAETYCLPYWKKVKYLTLQIISKKTFMTWKAHSKSIKKLVSLKESPNIAPSTIFHNNPSAIKRQEIAHTCNKYFC